MTRIAVIGAGVVGLSTAVNIQTEIPDSNVVIVSEKFGDETTSAGAPGVFRPTPDKTPDVPYDTARKWLSDSWAHYTALYHSPECKDAGVQLISGYQFYNDHMAAKLKLQSDVIYDFRECTEAEMQMYPGPRFKYGYRVTTLMVEGKYFLRYLMNKFLSKGGTLLKHKVESLEEFAGKFDIVVVCAGLGSREIMNDADMYACRGHLIKVKAPWIKNLIYADNNRGECMYIYPGRELVSIGGTRRPGDEHLGVREEEKQRIWQRACQMVPSLQKAEISHDWIGLRPFRAPLRLEKDTKHFRKGSLKVVYNYGHGGEGISLSWGTAMEATQLVKQHVQELQTMPGELQAMPGRLEQRLIPPSKL